MFNNVLVRRQGSGRYEIMIGRGLGAKQVKLVRSDDPEETYWPWRLRTWEGDEIDFFKTKRTALVWCQKMPMDYFVASE